MNEVQSIFLLSLSEAHFSQPSNYLLLTVLSAKPILKSMIFTKSDTRLTWTCWFKMIRSCFNFLLPTNYHMFWNRCAVQSPRGECWVQNDILQSLHLVWTRACKMFKSGFNFPLKYVLMRTCFSVYLPQTTSAMIINIRLNLQFISFIFHHVGSF